MIINIFTHSAEQTFRSAYVIGQSICGPRIFLIEGSLGVGKTVFCKGLICGLGLENSNDVTSPSFTLINEYLLRIPVFHVDLYRINNRRDLETLGLEEILGQAAVILVEAALSFLGLGRSGDLELRFCPRLFAPNSLLGSKIKKLDFL